MATYEGLAGRIISDIGRGDTSLTDTVKNHIQDAIRFYQTRRFWFNEGTTSISLTSSTANYNFPAGLLEVDSVTITDNGQRFELEPMSYRAINSMDSGTYFGTPYAYALFAQQFRFYPVPDTSFSVTVKYQKILNTLSASSDVTAWTNEAQNLISARVRKMLYATYYKDSEAAQIEQVREDQELAMLVRQTEKLSGDEGISGSGW